MSNHQELRIMVEPKEVTQESYKKAFMDAFNKDGKVHFGVVIDGWDHSGVVIICGVKSSKVKTTIMINDVTCKNCLRLIERDLEEAKDRAYPDRIRNKKTGTVLSVKSRKENPKRMKGKDIAKRKKGAEKGKHKLVIKKGSEKYV